MIALAARAACALLLTVLATVPSRAGLTERTLAIGDPGWRVFTTEAGTRVDVPAGIFTTPSGPSPRGEGIEVRSADERASLVIYVERNEDGVSPAEFVRSQLRVPAETLDYRRITDRFFAISGYHADLVYYSRCNFPSGRAGALHCISLSYPRAEEKAWDAIVTRISLSLRGPRE
jgi:hypothetical protein